MPVGGTTPGRVREGDTPPAPLGGMGERCKLPLSVPLFALKDSETTQKKKRGLLRLNYMY